MPEEGLGIVKLNEKLTAICDPDTRKVKHCLLVLRA
mgnify:CR=1 FL=1